MKRTLLAVTALFSLASLTAAAQSTPPGAACSQVKLSTTMGPITLQLDREKAPLSAENFARYVQSGHYNGTVFHRVIDGFMIQGGGFTRDMRQKPTNAPIRNESNNGLKNEPYTLAMARTSDPNSATAQFFINVEDNSRLNYASEMSPGYAVFGKVSGGKETVDKIRKVPTGNSGGHQNVPTTPVVIEKAECL